MTLLAREAKDSQGVALGGACRIYHWAVEAIGKNIHRLILRDINAQSLIYKLMATIDRLRLLDLTNNRLLVNLYLCLIQSTTLEQ